MLDALVEHRENTAIPIACTSKVQPKIVTTPATVKAAKYPSSRATTTSNAMAATSILEAGENAGLELAFGCRIGICLTCVGTLRSGELRDVRSGEISEPTERTADL